MEIEYKMPSQGLGSDFTESERPLTFAGAYENRFRNDSGGAERRPGMNRYSPPIAGGPNLTRLHEWIGNDGTDIIFSSDDEGNIWKFNVASSAWTSVLTGKASVRLLSAQAEDYLIFVNGEDRNFYSRDGGATFNELKALISQGKLAGGSNATMVIDGNVTNWISQTQVANNDIVYNITRNAYGIVATVASAALTTTIIGSAATGAGKTASGVGDQAPGDEYQLIDYVALNIIPQGRTTTNIAIAGAATTNTVVAVSALDFSTTEMRTGDFVYNTTRGAIGIIGSVSAQANLTTPILAQVSGDTFEFLKSAMPIAKWVHVHYGRVYFLDARKQTRIVISAPDSPEDVTTFQETLDSTSFSFGTQQPAGDVILTMGSFQQYFVAAGEKNLYIYRGISPVADTSSSSVDFTPIAFYPNGVYSRFGLGTNGTDLLHVTLEGVQAVNIGSISFTTVQNNVSVAIRNEIIQAISGSSRDDVQFSFYPRRSWIIVKVGTSVYILNTNPSFDQAGQLRSVPSWHLFTGKWAQQNHYFVRRNGDLLACGPSGGVYFLDNGGVMDDTDVVATNLETSWFRLEEPQRTPRIKQGQYIRPLFESTANVGYTLSIVAGWDGYSTDSIIVSALALGAGVIGQAIIGTTPIGQGTIVQADKYPLQWRGEQARLQIQTQSGETPDIITGFMIYGDIAGVR